MTEDNRTYDGGSGLLSPQTLTAIERLANCIMMEHGCKSGQTACYFALVGTVLKHAETLLAENTDER